MERTKIYLPYTVCNPDVVEELKEFSGEIRSAVMPCSPIGYQAYIVEIENVAPDHLQGVTGYVDRIVQERRFPYKGTVVTFSYQRYKTDLDELVNLYGNIAHIYEGTQPLGEIFDGTIIVDANPYRVTKALRPKLLIPHREEQLHPKV